MTKHETTAERLLAWATRLTLEGNGLGRTLTEYAEAWLAEKESLLEELYEAKREVTDEESRAIDAEKQRDALAEALREMVADWDDELPHDRQENFVGRAREALATLESPADALTRQGQEWGDYDGWITHDSEQMPEGLAPTQLIQYVLDGDNVFCARADQISKWGWVTKYRPFRDPDGVPCCAPDGLEKWAKYVATDETGLVWQYSAKPVCHIYPDEWSLENPAFGEEKPASDIYIKPGDWKKSPMRVWRGE